jgi:hypothetical protein
LQEQPVFKIAGGSWQIDRSAFSNRGRLHQVVNSLNNAPRAKSIQAAPE